MPAGRPAHSISCLLFAVLACVSPGCSGPPGSEWIAAAHPSGMLGACGSPLPDDARCANVSVVENRAAAGGRRIDLRVAVLPARGSSRAPDPVFVLAGGPGQAATDLMRVPIFVALRDTRDVVFMDQRGTGGSNALTCDFYGPPSEPASYFRAFLPLDQVRACRDRLASKADLTQYTTANSVEDLDDVRAALGYERINVMGGSYGTRLAMEYVRAHEQRVRSVILDAPVTPEVHMPENFGPIAQRALDALLDECAAVPACASAYPDGRGATRRVFDRLTQGPVKAFVTHPAGESGEALIEKSHVAEAIRYMLYTSRDAGFVPQYLHRADRGDYAAIAQFLMNRRRAGTFDGLYLSVTCTEDVPFVAADAEAREAHTFMAGYRVREQRAACGEWATGPRPAWKGTPVSSSVAALILSGALDPATPPENGEAIARAWPRSLHIVVPFGGHSPFGLIGLECLQEIRRVFVDRGSIEGIDTACVSRIRRPPFAGVGS